jgi:hypothetical protein
MSPFNAQVFQRFKSFSVNRRVLSSTLIAAFFLTITSFQHSDENALLEGTEKEKSEGKHSKKDDSIYDMTVDLTEKAEDAWKRILTDDSTSSTSKSVHDADQKKTVALRPAAVGNKLMAMFEAAENSIGFTEETKSGPEKQHKEKPSFSAMAKDFLGLIAGGDSKQDYLKDIVEKARQPSDEGEVVDTHSFQSLFRMLDNYKDHIESVAEKYMGSLDFSHLSPSALFYYLEGQDEVKNPSWKRRMHRFYPGINIKEVEDLNNILSLAYLSYADSVEDIREGLHRQQEPYELVYAEVRSEPGKPANFVAVKRDQSSFNPFLEVLIVIRGTKSVADALTGLLCDEVEYRGGKAHSFILGSGQHIADTHTGLLEELLEKSGKFNIKLTLTGHSLGAGAAAIAGMELRDHPKFDVNVIGFGCPALLSKKLAEQASYILTVVNDCDIVPRLSGIHLANLLLDIMEFDWLPFAKRDINHAIEELARRQPVLFTKDVTQHIRGVVEPLLDDLPIEQNPVERIKPELYPPGRCVHLYRDGSGISGNIVPNVFFSEIDVSRTMIEDHLYHSGYEKVFLELMRSHKDDHHFRFDSTKSE